MIECIKHGPHAPGECPECDELAEARSIVATTYIPPAPLSEEDQSKKLAHERLSKVAAEGGFTLGPIQYWEASNANCAAAGMERAVYYRNQNALLRGMIASIANMLSDNGNPKTGKLILEELGRLTS